MAICWERADPLAFSLVSVLLCVQFFFFVVVVFFFFFFFFCCCFLRGRGEGGLGWSYPFHFGVWVKCGKRLCGFQIAVFTL